MNKMDKHIKLQLITDTIREVGTDSPTTIHERLRKKNININRRTIQHHVLAIRAANASWGRGLTRTAWTEAQRQAYEDMSKILKRLMEKMEKATPTGAALTANAYCNVFMHRKYLMENGIIMEAIADLERSVDGNSTDSVGEETKA